MVSLYKTIQASVVQKRAKRNLQWLHELRTRRPEKITVYRAGQLADNAPLLSNSAETAEDLLLVGCKEKLVELGRRDVTTETIGADFFHFSPFDLSQDDSYVVSLRMLHNAFNSITIASCPSCSDSLQKDRNSPINSMVL